MSRLYTRRVLGSTAYAPLGVLERTVPATESWVIRNIIVHFAGTAATFLDVKVITSGDEYYLGHWLAADGPFHHLDLRQTVNAGEKVAVFTDVDGPKVAITAYKFLL